MLKEPLMMQTALFWTLWSFKTSDFCFPVNHNWQPYVRMGRQTALYISLHCAKLIPWMELPRTWRDSREAHALLHMISMCHDQLSLWLM